jgi:hypothetical protein
MVRQSSADAVKSNQEEVKEEGYGGSDVDQEAQ